MPAVVLTGNALHLPVADETVQCVVTSPPYWGLRDYGVAGQLGQEYAVEDYVRHLVEVFREVRRVLRDDGTVWLNLGDCYAGSGRGLMGDGTPSDRGLAKQATNRGTSAGTFPPKGNGTLKAKDLVGVPWRVAFALQEDGWWLRSDCIWHKPSAMPESVKDRPTLDHEHVFLLAKRGRYFYNGDAIREPITSRLRERRLQKDTSTVSAKWADRASHWGTTAGGRNRRTVWSIASASYSGPHYATMPVALASLCVLAGTRPGDLVLDPFAGSGTTGVAAVTNGRSFIGLDLNPAYTALARRRLAACQPGIGLETIAQGG